MSNPNSNSKRSQGNRADDGANDERAPKRAKDEHVSASLAAAAIEEPLPLAESAALSVPLMAAAKVSVPMEPAEAPAPSAVNLYAKRATRHFPRPPIASVPNGSNPFEDNLLDRFVASIFITTIL
jgi:hypothetical protein